VCYAPQFGAAKDPVNLAGMLAENVLNGDMPVGDWLELDRTDALLVDVRETDEFSRGHIPKAISLLSRSACRYMELPNDRDIWVCCAVGQRAYFAARFLTQHGDRSRNVLGGYTTYRALKAAGLAP
jgi:rhodanese-related sulfurtransferase